MQSYDHFLQFIGYTLAIIGTAFFSSVLRELRGKVKSSIPKTFKLRREENPKRYFSQQFNKEVRDVTIRLRNQAGADRCFIYTMVGCVMYMTYEDTEVGISPLIANRQGLNLFNEGRDTFEKLRDITQLAGVVEVDVTRNIRGHSDVESRHTGWRKVFLCDISKMDSRTLPAVLMRDSHTKITLLAPLVNNQACGIPYIHVDYRLNGILGVDFKSSDVDIMVLHNQVAFYLADAQETFNVLFRAEMITNKKIRGKLTI